MNNKRKIYIFELYQDERKSHIEGKKHSVKEVIPSIILVEDLSRNKGNYFLIFIVNNSAE